MISKNRHGSGFTIVELLVVIVVIGILATISIVAYSGITKKATLASLTSDLDNASKLLKMDYVINSAYPASLATANGGRGVPASANTTYADYQVDNSTSPPGFCLNVTSPNSTSFRITDDSKPSPGNCSRTSCLDILNANESSGNGIYWIKPAGTAFRAYCDMTTNGGGWTLIGKGRDGWNWTNVGQGNISDIAINSMGNSVAFMPATTITSIIGKNVNSLTDGVRLYRFGPNQDWRIGFSTMTTWDWNMDASSFPVNIFSRSPACTGVVIGNSNDSSYCGAANDCDRIFTWAWDGHNNVRGWSSGAACGCYDYGSFGWCFAGEGHVLLMSQVWVRS